jgi:hypothetical protein
MQKFQSDSSLMSDNGLFCLHPDVYGDRIPFTASDLISVLDRFNAREVVGSAFEMDVMSKLVN